MKQELVRDWMSEEVITITPETTLPDAEQLMITHVIRRLPVVADDGCLVGIITESDIFRLVAREWARQEEEVSL